jgi:hypothetical protein
MFGAPQGLVYALVMLWVCRVTVMPIMRVTLIPAGLPLALFSLCMGVRAVSWSSRLQPTVAVSTAEAEYMAAASAVKEALWLKKLFAVFGRDVSPVHMFCDNQAAIKLIKHPIASMRSKHIDVQHHFVRERVARGEVVFEYCSTNQMVADCMTKALPVHKFHNCFAGMGVGE